MICPINAVEAEEELVVRVGVGIMTTTTGGDVELVVTVGVEVEVGNACVIGVPLLVPMTHIEDPMAADNNEGAMLRAELERPDDIVGWWM